MEFDLGRLARSMTKHLFGTDIVANNLANINTTGFKRDSSFTDWLVEATSSIGMERYTDHSKGDLQQTGNPMDLALSMAGFFVVQTPTGQAYTRNGHFTVSEEGFIETAQGFQLMGEHGPISVLGADGLPAPITVTRKGEVYIDGELVANILIANVPNPNILQKMGSNVFSAQIDTEVRYMDFDEVDIRQGMLEGSNVQPVVEMVSLIEMQRNFESTQRVAKAMDNILGRATQLGDYR